MLAHQSADDGGDEAEEKGHRANALCKPRTVAFRVASAVQEEAEKPNNEQTIIAKPRRKYEPLERVLQGVLGLVVDFVKGGRRQECFVSGGRERGDGLVELLS